MICGELEALLAKLSLSDFFALFVLVFDVFALFYVISLKMDFKKSRGRTEDYKKIAKDMHEA